MRFLHAAGPLLDENILNSAWSEKQSFVFVPARLREKDSLLDEFRTQIPCELKSNHFGLLTSGSTGQPKIVIGRRERAEALANVLHRVQDSDPVAETICALPLTYSYAFVNQWLWARVTGREFRSSMGLASPQELREDLIACKDAMLCLVGSQVSLLQSYYSGLKFPGVIRLHFAGGRFPQAKLEFLRELFPNASIYNNFGCAEALPRLTVRKATDSDDARNIGLPLPGIELRSEQGALQFRSPYAAIAAITEEGFNAFQEHEWIPTGDYGHVAPDSDSWLLAGRSNDVFNRYGEKVSLAAVHTTVEAEWPGQFVLFKTTDSNGEEGGALALSPIPSKQQIRSILGEIRKQHNRAHWPLYLCGMEQLPMLSNGKPDLVSLASISKEHILWRQHL